jgi:hypothetical protein
MHSLRWNNLKKIRLNFVFIYDIDNEMLEFDRLLKSSDKIKINDAWKHRLVLQDHIAKKFYDLSIFVIDKYNNQMRTKFKVFLGIINGVQKINSHYTIKNAGPIFWKFKYPIVKGNIEWIYKYEFEKQMEDMVPTHYLYHIKVLATEVPSEKCAQMCQHFLKWYCSYSNIQKEIMELSNRLNEI